MSAIDSRCSSLLIPVFALIVISKGLLAQDAASSTNNLASEVSSGTAPEAIVARIVAQPVVVPGKDPLRTFHRDDTNHDGKITLQEFRPRLQANPATKVGVERLFRRLDKNNDGSLSFQEFKESPEFKKPIVAAADSVTARDNNADANNADENTADGNAADGNNAGADNAGK